MTTTMIGSTVAPLTPTRVRQIPAGPRRAPHRGLAIVPVLLLAGGVIAALPLGRIAQVVIDAAHDVSPARVWLGLVGLIVVAGSLGAIWDAEDDACEKFDIR